MLVGCAALAACAITERTHTRDGRTYGVIEGAFRGRWYNFYERALSFLEGGYYDEAIADLEQARALRPHDQRRARTYGLHFIDYFPNRELGVALLGKGDIDGALAALETSLGHVDSGRAEYYFNEARRRRLEARGVRDSTPPRIELHVADGTLTRSARFAVRGEVRDSSMVAAVSVNGRTVLIPTAVDAFTLDAEVELGDGDNELTVRAYDLFGNSVERRVVVILDRDAPRLSITEVGTHAGERFLRVELEDPYGVASLQVNGKRLAPDPQHGFRSLTVPAPGERLRLKAEDLAGNVTEIDLQPEQLAQELQQADGDPPKLVIGDVPATVYDEQVFIDGQVSDATAVASLTLNGQAVATGGKRTVYFRRVVPLAPGKNSITIAASDAKGRETKRTLEITRVLPASQALEQRLAVAMAPLATLGGDGAGTAAVEENLATALVEQRRFHLLDRSRAAALVTEWQLVATDLAKDGPDLLRLGEALASDTTLLGWVKERQESIEVYVRLVDTETQQIILEKDVFHEKKSLRSVQELLYGLGLKLKAALPVLDGELTQTGGDALAASLRNAGLLPQGARLLLVERPEGAPERIAGEARLVAVDGDEAKLTLVRGSGAPGVKVVTK